MKPKFVDLPAETEPVRRQTYAEIVVATLAELGGFATKGEIVRASGLSEMQVSDALQNAYLRHVDGGWWLPEVLRQCPTCGAEQP